MCIRVTSMPHPPSYLSLLNPLKYAPKRTRKPCVNKATSASTVIKLSSTAPNSQLGQTLYADVGLCARRRGRGRREGSLDYLFVVEQHPRFVLLLSSCASARARLALDDALAVADVRYVLRAGESISVRKGRERGKRLT